MANTCSLIDAVQQFSTEGDAEAWFIEKRWGLHIRCAFCDGLAIKIRKNHKPMPFWCRDCRRYISVRTNTLMERSKIPLQKWASAFYLFATRPQGISSVLLPKTSGPRKGALGTWATGSGNAGTKT